MKLVIQVNFTKNIQIFKIIGSLSNNIDDIVIL